jgi:hypothetical protein
MIPGLKKIDGFLGDAVHQAMFLRNTPRPTICEQMPQRLRFAQTLEGVAHDCLDQLKYPKSSAPVRFNPKSQILAKLRLKDSGPVSFRWHPASLAAVPLRLRVSVCHALRVPTP